MSKEKLFLEFEQDECYINLKISENFETENPLFDELAHFLGAVEHHHQKDCTSIHLTTLEKLEILCKKARLYAEEEKEFEDKYNEIRILKSNDGYLFNNYNNPVDTEYNDIKLMSNELILVRKGDLHGILDLAGSTILPVIFNEIYLASENIISARTKESISLYSADGKVLHADLEDFSENYNPFGNKEPYFWLKKEGKWGLFDYELKQIIPFRFEYDSCELISDNAKNNIYIKVYSGRKCGLINGLLNVEVLKLNKDIKDIVMPGRKNFLIIK
ncbi:hypothetical protein [Chryseobacterium sp. 5_R23647]|uniref:hypothetical protein n=1 Tax=Chryseobacterium sp. 5_R23647 TaxID=2258964 RepID=UPI000E284727|nr:hypothetical protein [Chryseobacterium sp. 5_R23647]REC45879.1 hypothetical protein DRF69_01840 [Chryseobacterium sp. 5_R23647]